MALLVARSTGRTLHELGETMTAQEFGLWAALHALDPWGEPRADLRNGIVAALIANVHRNPKSSPFAPKDFMPDFDPAPTPEPTQQDVLNFLKSIDG